MLPCLLYPISNALERKSCYIKNSAISYHFPSAADHATTTSFSFRALVSHTLPYHMAPTKLPNYTFSKILTIQRFQVWLREKARVFPRSVMIWGPFALWPHVLTHTPIWIIKVGTQCWMNGWEIMDVLEIKILRLPASQLQVALMPQVQHILSPPHAPSQTPEPSPTTSSPLIPLSTARISALRNHFCLRKVTRHQFICLKPNPIKDGRLLCHK